MGKISSLTLVLGAACNFSCSYCPQRRGADRLRQGDITAFLNLLRPRLAGRVLLRFTGGEPLLHWPLIAGTVRHAGRLAGTEFRFARATNGSLLDRGRIRYLREHGFLVGLSHDGAAQAGRDAGSVAAVTAALGLLRRFHPDGYVVNSVFTPRTVPLLATSVAGLLRDGHRRLRFTLDRTAAWQPADLDELEGQMARVVPACREHRRRGGGTPLENLAPADGRGVFACGAGRDRLALLPDRTVWGCELFHPLFGQDGGRPELARHCMGTLERFLSAGRRRTAAPAGAALRQDYFIVGGRRRLCGLCADLERCAVCPATAALATGVPGVLPAWTCRLQRILLRAGQRLRRDIVPAAIQSPIAGQNAPLIEV